MTAPEELEGSVIYTYGENAKIASENEIFYLTGTTLPVYYPGNVAMAHPLENSLLSCDAETGETSWTYSFGGRCAGIFYSPDERSFVLPVGKDTSSCNNHVQGSMHLIPGSPGPGTQSFSGHSIPKEFL